MRLTPYSLLLVSLICLSGCSEGALSGKGDGDTIAKADSVETAIVELYEKGFRVEADSILNHAFTAEEMENRYVLKKYYGMKGHIRVREQRFQEALEFSTKYLSVIDTTNAAERQEYARQLTSHGSIYFNLQNYNAAYRYYHKARRLLPDDKCFVGYSDYSIAMVLYRQADFESALASFKHAFNGYQACEPEFVYELRKQEILSNTGLCYTHMKKYDSALYYYNLAADFIRQMEEKEPSHTKWKELALGVIAGNKARAFAGQNQLDSAMHYVLQDIAVNLRPSYDLGQGAGSLLHLGALQFRMKQYNSMDTTLQFADGLIANLGEPKFRLEWLGLKRRYAHATKQWDSAAYYAERYINLQDSLVNDERQAFNNHVEMALSNLDSEFEMGLLKRENEYRIASFNYLLWILALVLGVILATVFFLVSSRRKNRQLASKSEELQHSNKELQLLNTEKDRILGIAAHDLRTPIAGIIAMVAMLKEEKLTAQEQKELIALIETSGRSSLELINEILLLGDLKDGGIAKKLININEFLASTVALIRFKADEKRQEIKVSLLKDDTVINADPEKLRRALSNIIINAIKFSNEGSVISVGAELLEQRVKFFVNDKGIGIPSYLKQGLFNSFTNAKRPGTNGEKPFGMGLSIVKQIVEKHQGRVWVDSEEGQGCTFFVELPA